MIILHTPLYELAKNTTKVEKVMKPTIIIHISCIINIGREFNLAVERLKFGSRILHIHQVWLSYIGEY